MSHWSYLPFLLAWALPIVALEWLAGARQLWRERRVWPWIVCALTAWFTFADAIAIHAGIWRFNPATLLGLYLGPVPVEEILFYLLTTTMVVQGYVLFHAGLARRSPGHLPRRARHSSRPPDSAPTLPSRAPAPDSAPMLPSQPGVNTASAFPSPPQRGGVGGGAPHAAPTRVGPSDG